MNRKICFIVLLFVGILFALVQPVFCAVLKEEYQPTSLWGGPPDGFQTSGVYDSHEDYVVASNNYHADLAPLRPTAITASEGSSFLTTLRNAFPESSGWSFLVSASSLPENSLIVRTYDVQGTPSRVGCEFHVEFAPPTPTINVHWIQVITNNHALGGEHGTITTTVDIVTGNPSPYYDGANATGAHYAADGSNFYDFPGRLDTTKSHWWQAQLYLVTGPPQDSPGSVTFYNTGISWGWTNVPEPATLMLLALGGLTLLKKRK